MARTKAVLGSGARLSDHISVALLALNCPLERVRETLRATSRGSKRRRDLPAEVLVFYVMALTLYRHAAYEEVLKVVIEGLRAVYGDEIGGVIPSKGAISHGRKRLGSEPLARLYEERVGPVGPVGMVGVWFRGYRVMGLDGSTLDLADEAANVEQFGYPGASRGEAAFPQMRFTALAECGTHVLIGAQMGEYRMSEHQLALGTLAYADASMIVLADRGFVSFPLWQAAHARGSKLLFRQREGQVFEVERSLPDGSYLSSLYRNPKARRRGGSASNDRITVRVIEYELQSAGGPERYRLITNWLDDTQAPALELAELYHRRWKVEEALNEIKTRLNNSQTLRSKTPDLVRQEFYALLITHAAIRKLMTQAASETQQASEDLSFLAAVQILRRRIPAGAAIPP